MKQLFSVTIAIFIFAFCVGANQCKNTQEDKDSAAVDKQQSQYAKAQPIPFFDWSLERNLILQLYQIRNAKVATHAVWRSNYGMIEGDCPSLGFGIPYDTSLTNPLKGDYITNSSAATIEQAEPNGIFASKNTSATWVMCVGSAGVVEPVYVESKVTIYPGPVKVDYEKNRAVRFGDATVKIDE